jgi:hypothetical protein
MEINGIDIDLLEKRIDQSEKIVEKILDEESPGRPCSRTLEEHYIKETLRDCKHLLDTIHKSSWV